MLAIGQKLEHVADALAPDHDHYLSNAHAGECGDGVIDHRPVVDRQEMLVGDDGEGKRRVAVPPARTRPFTLAPWVSASWTSRLEAYQVDPDWTAVRRVAPAQQSGRRVAQTVIGLADAPGWAVLAGLGELPGLTELPGPAELPEAAALADGRAGPKPPL